MEQTDWQMALFWLRPRPRHLEASLGVSHGGVAVVAAPGVRLTSVNIGVDGVSEMHRLFWPSGGF